MGYLPSLRLLMPFLLAIPVLGNAPEFQLLAAGNGGDPKTLETGASAPDFHLKGVDGKAYSLKSFSSARILVVVFMCNHCPTSQA